MNANYLPDEPTLDDTAAPAPAPLPVPGRTFDGAAASWFISFGAHSLLLVLLALVVVGAQAVVPPAPIVPVFQPQLTPRPPATLPPIQDREIPVPERPLEFTEISPPDPRLPEAERAETRSEEPRAHLVQGSLEAVGALPDVGFSAIGPLGLADPAGRTGLPEGGGLRDLRTSRPTWPIGMTYPLNAGLRWLADHQESDGHWDCRRYGGAPDKPEHEMGEYDVAVTGLAVLAFLGAGHTADSSPNPRYQACVRQALYWLRDRQRPDGSWCALNYAQAIATLAAAEHFALTGQDREMAQRAVDCLAARQNRRVGGWDYFRPDTGRTDTSISGWGVMALKSARLAELAVGESLERARIHFTAAAGGGGSELPARIWYSLQNGQGDNAGRGTAQLPITALALLFLGVDPSSPWLVQAAARLAGRGPNLANLYETYYASLFMMQVGGESWERYQLGLRTALPEAQVKTGDDRGSWDPAGDRYGAQGGRVYTTALGVLILESWFRYLPVYE